MKKLFMQQKALTLKGNFSVKDEYDEAVYFVEGTFMQVPKRFIVTNSKQEEVAVITKKPISFLPTFYVEAYGQELTTIKRNFTFFKARYSIDAAGIEVNGNWWDMDFDVIQHGEVVGTVNKEWFTWGQSYVLTIYDEKIEALLVSLVVAINYVKASQAAAGAAASV